MANSNSSKPPTSQRKTTPKLAAKDSARAIKRRKVDHEDTQTPRTFLNPFAPQPTMPLAAQDSDLDASSDRPPPRTYTQVPPAEYEYAYTPEISVAEAERRGSDTTPTPPAEVSSPLPSTSTQSPAPSMQSSSIIDPALLQETPTPTNPGKQSKKITAFGLPSTPVFGKPNSGRNPFLASKTPTQLNGATLVAALPPPAHPTSSFQPQEPPSSGLSPTPHMPKAFTDKLVQQARKIAELEARQLELKSKLEYLTGGFEGMGEEFAADVNDLANEQRLLLEHVYRLEKTVTKQGKLIELLFQNLDLKDDDDEMVKTSSKPKGRDNLLNNAVRQSIYLAMGLPTTSKLQAAAAVPPPKSGGSYVKDPESKGKLLRPDWGVSFTENSTWHNAMVKFVREKAPTLVPALTPAKLSQRSDDVILKRLEVVFKNISTEYRKTGADQEARQDADADDEDDGSKNRRRARKARKCEERQETMLSENIELPPEYSWFLQPLYQSTDESDHDAVIDPDTDTEETAEVPAKRTRKPWITRVPLYRSEVFDAGIRTIDESVMKRRKLNETNNRGKTVSHPRVRGPKKDTPLPFIGSAAGKKGKIRKFAIDPEWLALHSDQDTPSRIHLSEDEKENGKGKGKADNEEEADREHSQSDDAL
ncbi:hypothetical protein C8R45DRAFT_1165683 [Mycena sanguinolenta]|nr:hypothetical protein C8R45DRAFT_1165683 [Mycena sanguinolenta]